VSGTTATGDELCLAIRATRPILALTRSGIPTRVTTVVTTEYRHPGWERGYGDGVEKGREDAVRNRRYEPNRHSWCRSGTRGYDRRLGSKDEYINVYREAFTAGYAEGFR